MEGEAIWCTGKNTNSQCCDELNDLGQGTKLILSSIKWDGAHVFSLKVSCFRCSVSLTNNYDPTAIPRMVF